MPGEEIGFSGTLTILVLTSFSIALTSSAALGTSAELCREASSTDDYMTAAGGQEERDISRRKEAEQEVLRIPSLSSFGLGRSEAKAVPISHLSRTCQTFHLQIKRKNNKLYFA